MFKVISVEMYQILERCKFAYFIKLNGVTPIEDVSLHKMIKNGFQMLQGGRFW